MRTKNEQQNAIAKALLLGMSLFASGYSQGNQYSNFSLEELSTVPLVMSAKADDRLFDAPSGAFVFDEEEISRLPVDSIPEMLRYAPGVHIQRSSNGTWGVGIRGMNSRFFNRVHFNVDEQSIYGNLMGGFFGVQHDLLLEDVASVEVVYGPGGGMWGHNSANGRINVVMKSAFETENSIFKTQYGTHNTSVSARHGWKVNDNTSARIYLKLADRAASYSPIFHDSWDRQRAGFQIDHRPSSRDLFSFSAESYESNLGFARADFDLQAGIPSLFENDEIHKGYNGQVKWTRQIDAENGFILRGWAGQSEYDNYEFFNSGVEGRLRARLSENQSIVLTAGGTIDNQTLSNSNFIIFRPNIDPDSWTSHTGGEYTYSPNNGDVDIVLGISGSYESVQDAINWLPSAKVIYRRSDSERIWLSFSQSSRIPPSGVRDVEQLLLRSSPIEPIDIPTPFGPMRIDHQLSAVEFLQNLTNENSDAIQLGYRKQYGQKTSLIVNGFYYTYTDVYGGVELGATPELFALNPYLRVDIGATNIAEGESYGFETSYNVAFTSALSGTFNYAFIKDDFNLTILPPGAALESFPILLGEISRLNNNVPENIASAWLTAQLVNDFRADIGIRYTSGFSHAADTQPSVFQSDIRLSWEPDEKLRVSIVGRNLLQSRTDETALSDNFGLGTEQESEAYIELRYEF